MLAKIINETTKEVQIGTGTNTDFYKSLGFTEMEVEQAYTGNWYAKGYAPEKPHNEVILEQIKELEIQITDRNLRGAILGVEFALNKITEIEEQIAELRKQLGV